MRLKLIKSLLFLLPLVFHPIMNVGMGQEAFTQAIVIFISLSLLLIFSRIPLTIRFFYIWMLITTFTSTMPRQSAFAFVFVTIFVLLYKVMLSLNKEELTSCFKIMAIACFVQGFWILTQIANVDFLMNATQDIARTWGTTAHHLFLSAMLLFSLVPVYLYKKWLVIPMVVGIFFCRQGSAIYALWGGAAFHTLFGYLKHKWIILIILIAIIPLCFLVDNPFKTPGAARFPTFQRIIELSIKDRLWIGQGLGTFKYEFWPKAIDIGGLRWMRAHNMFLQTMREQGLIGMILFILIPLRLFVHFLQNRNRKTLLWMTAIVMICLNGLGNFTDRNFITVYYAVFILSCYRVFNMEKIDGRTCCNLRWLHRWAR